MKGRTPNKAEKLHMSRVADLGCIVCLNEHEANTPASIHHIDGKTKEGAHMNILPLCYNHHQGGSDCQPFISRHPWKARFEAEYGTEETLLEQVNNMVEYPF